MSSRRQNLTRRQPIVVLAGCLLLSLLARQLCAEVTQLKSVERRRLIIVKGNKQTDLREQPAASPSAADGEEGQSPESTGNQLPSSRRDKRTTSGVGESSDERVPASPELQLGSWPGNQLRSESPGSVVAVPLELRVRSLKEPENRVHGTSFPDSTGMVFVPGDMGPRQRNIPAAGVSDGVSSEFPARTAPTLALDHWFENRLLQLVLALMITTACSIVVVAQLLIVTRRFSGRLPPMTRFELPVNPWGGSHDRAYIDRAHIEIGSHSDKGPSENFRTGIVVDLADQPLPIGATEGMYEQRCQQEHERRAQQEQAIFEKILQDNLGMRERMQTQAE